MTTHLSRRHFIALSTAATLCGVAVGGAAAQPAAAAPAAAGASTTLKKALIIGRPTEAALKSIKDAGFDGVESNDWKATPEEAAAARRTADKLGMRIHSVLFGWAQFNDPNAVSKWLADVEKALRCTAAYGADALLLVPCRIGGQGLAIPDAWDFDLDFDPQTGHLKRVVKDEAANAKFLAYIAAHNQAEDASRAAVRRLIPIAQETKVVIALENVWNNLWVKPAHFQNFVASFASPWVKAYLDLGNHVKYAPTPEWVRTLGKLIAKCHVKDFKLNENGKGGSFVNIRDGSIDWPATRQALAEVGYADWLTIEGGNLSQAEHSKRLDLIIAGK